MGSVGKRDDQQLYFSNCSPLEKVRRDNLLYAYREGLLVEDNAALLPRFSERVRDRVCTDCGQLGEIPSPIV